VPSSTSIESPLGDRGFLTVSVPSDAKVTLNGLPTKSLGSERQYFWHGMVPGKTYTLEVRVDVVREGKIVTQKKTVSLTAGEHPRVALSFNPAATEGLASSK